MESSDAETGMTDCAVGTIVWVRRRNGSWWPGKILGPDELSASHLMSPRSGTPVKLLGREDASVDWYNLEKSKRVKPFRCGEFDDCIERAEASQGMPPKKREKYARREDAILHALELEKQVLEKKYGKSNGGLSTKLLGKETTPEHISRDNVDEKRKLQSRSGSHVNVDDKRPDVHSFRDLIPPFKHKLSSLAASNGSHRHAADGETVGSRKLLEKRKRTQEGNNNNNNSSNMEESVGKRRDRHRPLVQVLQSTHPLQSKPDEQREVVAIANDPGMTAAGDHHRETLPSSDQLELEVELEVEVEAPPIALSEDNTTGSNEDTETDSSGTESLISDTYDAMAALSGEDMEFIPKAKAFGKYGEDSDDDNDSVVSKWQLKGKRNRRSSVRKRKIAADSRNWMMGVKGGDIGIGLGLGGYSYNNNLNINRGGGGGLDMGMGWDDEPWDVNHGGMLIDVEVGVQSGYQREHVPMISLMSKLNDKAIVGHPIPIQALQDGSSDIILGEMMMVPEPTTTPTPRRTNSRSSRPPHLSTLEEEEQQQDEKEQEHYYYYDDDEDGKRSAAGSFKGRKKPQRRSTSSFSPSQKIRTLSSIGGTHHHQSMDMREAGQGIMKPESLPTAVACIPVKLVFSRLHEELLVARHQ